MENNIAPQLMRDARVLTIGEGPNETLGLHLGRGLIQTEGFHRFLAERIGSPALSNRLGDDVRQVVERCESQHSAFDDRSAAVSWSCFLAARLACEGLMLAAVESAARQPGGARIGRVLTWAKVRYEEVVRRSLLAATGEPGALTPSEATELVSAYEGSIGDIEQDLPGEEQTLDPLLRRIPTLAPGGFPSPELEDSRVMPTSSPVSEARNSHAQPAVPVLLSREEKRALLQEALRSRITRQQPTHGSLQVEPAESP
jgi:hypothetical protein